MFKKALSFILIFSILLGLAACGQQAEPVTETDPVTADYSVTVHTQGGMAMAGIEVLVYDGDSLVSFGQTDETGAFVANLPEKDSYTLQLGSVPKGYAFEETYAFTGTAADITLTSALRTDENLSDVSLKVGDVMVDFSVALPDGTQVTLSEVLEEKKVVLLNFWYSSCGPCANEFPYMQAALDAFPDAAVIAADPLEDNNAVAMYQSTMGLTFPMAACPAAWSNTFNLSGYPTSVVIDRYGVICLVEVGAVTSQRPFTKLFEHFTAENYVQKLFGSLSELVTVEKPNVSMPASSEIAAVLSPALNITYRPEENPKDAEYAWPFVITEKLGEACIQPSNQEMDGSFAILYSDIYLEKGQAVAFDYLSSTELGCDCLYVIVDGQDVQRISGWNEEEKWETCYPWVAEESRSYEVALCYFKDGDSFEGDDTVYLKNLRILDAAAIESATYIPRLAATEKDSWEYAQILYNEADGYYHVGTADGPLLLVDLMNYTQFNEEKTIWDLTYDGVVSDNGRNIYDENVDFFSYASNSQLSGIRPVTEELKEFLELVDSCCGFDETDTQEWLKACRYYEAYGTDQQLSDPIAGLATFSAYTAREGKNVDTNYFYYDRPIMPRGLLARFTPEKTGVYRITSRCESENGVDAWIFGEDRDNDHYTYEPDLRIGTDNKNANILYFMEAGQDYYIDIAFWDIYEVGYIYYDIEYVGRTYDAFRLASPGYFTYDTNATGEHMYDIIAGGIDVVLGEDGIYYHDLGDGKKGSPLYADFTGITGLFSQPLVGDGNIKGIIEMGGFDFSKTDLDMEILSYLNKYDGDTEAVKEYLRAYWAEDYDLNAENYHLDEVLAGKYHGMGEDLTTQIESYLDDIITSGPEERRGCVVVTEALAQLLQSLVDKYSFSGVDHSWTKLCYYYDYMGRN